MRKLLLATTAIVVLWVSPAMAGPLVGGITALLGTTIGATGATVGGILGGIALNFGASYLVSLFTPEPKQRGIKQETENGAGNPPQFIVGRYATPGTFVYQGVLNEGDIPNQCYVQVIALSMLPVKGIESQLFIQGKRCNVNLNSNWPGGFKEVTEYVQGGGGGGYCLMKFYDGTQNSVDSWLLNKFRNHPDYPIHEDSWWRGCAYVIIQNWYSNKGVWTGWPEFRFVVEGIDLYDPRKDSSVGGSGAQRWNQPSTWGKAPANAKVFEYNAIRGIRYKGKWQWGGTAEAYRLPLAEWFAAMNACDEDLPVKGGGTVKRGHIGAEIGYDDDPREIITEINKHVSGYTSLIGGFYKTWCGSPGLSVMTITDEDFAITDEREDELFKSPRETYNTAYAYYPDSRGKWEMKDSPRYVDRDALEAAGEEFAVDVQLPFFTHPVPVQRALRSIVKDSQRDVTHRGLLPPEAYVLDVFDRVTYISADNGYASKAFRMDVIEDLNDVRQDALIREINANDDGWISEYELEDPVSTSEPIIPPPPVLDVNVTADSIDTASGKDKPAIRAAWTWGGIDIDVRNIDWRIRRTGTTRIIARGTIEAPEDNEALITSSVLRFGTDFDIQFWPAPYGDRKIERTAWKTLTMLPVDAPTGLELTVISVMGADKKLDYFVLADWTAVAQRNEGYKIRVTIDGRSRTYSSPDNQHTIPVSAPSSVTVAIATKATDGGTASAWCEPKTIAVTKRAANSARVKNLEVRRVPKGFRLNWDPSDSDYHEKFGIFANTVENFATATFLDFTTATTYLDDRPRARGQEMFFWAFDYDKAGNAGEAAAPVSAEYTLIESADIDPDFKEEIDAKVQVVTDQVAADIAAMIETYDAEIADIQAELASIGGGAGGTAAQAMARIRELGAMLRNLAAQASMQGTIAFTQKEELRAEVGADRASFTSQIDVIVADALALAERATTLEATTGALGSGLGTLQTTVATGFETLAGQITTLNSVMSGKAEASLVETLTTQVEDVDGKVTSLAEAITEVNAGSVSGDVASVRTRMAAQGSAPAGYNARYAIEVRAATGQSFSAAGLYIDVNNAGLSRVVIEAGKFMIITAAGAVVPFSVSGNTVTMTNVQMAAANVTGTITASQINVGTLASISTTSGPINISSAVMGSLTVGTLNIAGNAATVSGSAEGSGSLSVAANAETTIASYAISWGSSAPQNLEIGYQFRSTETMNYKLRIYFGSTNVTSRAAQYIPMRATFDDIMSASDFVTIPAGFTGGTFSITLQRDESGVPATPVRGCYIKVTAQKR